MDWTIKDPNNLEFETRRSRAQFAFYCVLIAFTEVFRGWQATWGTTDSTNMPFKWLLLQLFPAHFLKMDYFELLAMALYKSCNPEEVLKHEAFYFDFYEAHMMGKLLPDKFMSSRPLNHNSKGLRPVLSPILRSVKSALHRLPIISGTGLTLLEEWKSVTSGIGTRNELVFTDFPLLNQKQIQELVKSFLLGQNEPIEHAVKWLIGRPCWVTEFIVDAITSNQPISICIAAFVTRMTSEVDSESQPRTIRGAFQRVAEMAGVFNIAGNDEFNPYEAVLRDAFLLSMGCTPKPRKSPLLLEFGLGFSNSDQNISLKLEPLVLETARLLVAKNNAFYDEFLRLVSEDASAYGKRFELVAAPCLLQSFTSQNLELHPLLQSMGLPDAFTGRWSVRDSMELFGMLSCSFSTAQAFYDPHVEPIQFPDNNAGPDTVLTLFQGGRELKIFIQDRVVNTLDLNSAKLTVDPAKFHHQKRGKHDEKVIDGVRRMHAAYVKGLTGPVIRVVVSVLRDFTQVRTEWIPNGRGSQDLLLLIDSTNAEPVFGAQLWKFMRECRS